MRLLLDLTNLSVTLKSVLTASQFNELETQVRLILFPNIFNITTIPTPQKQLQVTLEVLKSFPEAKLLSSFLSSLIVPAPKRKPSDSSKIPRSIRSELITDLTTKSNDGSPLYGKVLHECDRKMFCLAPITPCKHENPHKHGFYPHIPKVVRNKVRATKDFSILEQVKGVQNPLAKYFSESVGVSNIEMVDATQPSQMASGSMERMPVVSHPVSDVRKRVSTKDSATIPRTPEIDWTLIKSPLSQAIKEDRMWALFQHLRLHRKEQLMETLLTLTGSVLGAEKVRDLQQVWNDRFDSS